MRIENVTDRLVAASLQPRSAGYKRFVRALRVAEKAGVAVTTTNLIRGRLLAKAGIPDIDAEANT